MPCLDASQVRLRDRRSRATALPRIAGPSGLIGCLHTENPFPGRGDLTLSGFVAAAAVAVALVCAAWWLSLQESRAAAWVSHTHQVLTGIARTRAALIDIQNGV